MGSECLGELGDWGVGRLGSWGVGRVWELGGLGGFGSCKGF